MIYGIQLAYCLRLGWHWSIRSIQRLRGWRSPVKATAEPPTKIFEFVSLPEETLMAAVGSDLVTWEHPETMGPTSFL